MLLSQFARLHQEVTAEVDHMNLKTLKSFVSHCQRGDALLETKVGFYVFFFNFFCGDIFLISVIAKNLNYFFLP